MTEELTDVEIARAIEKGEWCFSCCKVEPLPEHPFRVCAECWHVFSSEAELLDADEQRRGYRLPSGSRVPSCPLCAHDF